MTDVLLSRSPDFHNDPVAAKTPRRVAVVANTSWFLHNFRGKLMEALGAAGHDVVAIAPEDDFTQKIRAAGHRFHAVDITRTGVNPLRELKTLLALRSAFKEERPDVVFSFTPKGNIYSALVAPRETTVVPSINGLGRVFTRSGWRRFLVTQLYRAAMSRTDHVFIENEDDVAFFLERCHVPPENCEKIPGLGVDLEKFAPSRTAPSDGGPVFLLMARLLWEKGLQQYADAAKAVKERHPQARFQILGPIETGHESAVPKEALDEWVHHGAIEYLGVTSDVRPYVHAADCIVLPSFYKEGVPRSLLESAAMGKALITTDTAGCRTTVDDGISGYLCQPRDTGDLAKALEKFVALSPDARRQMGLAGRAKMVREFAEGPVIARYLAFV